MPFALISKPGSSMRRAAKAPVIQSKLKVGQAHDAFEREADRVADEIVRMPQRIRPADTTSIKNAPSSIQRMCTTCAEEDEKVRRLPSRTPSLPPISTLNGPLKAQLTSLPETMDSPEATVAAPLEQSIHLSRGRGIPLPTSTRGFLEQRFGRDLGGIRIHADKSSSDLAERLQSRAFTVGPDIFFGPGEFAPHTSSGLRVLSHELTHVVQQGATPSAIPATRPQVPVRSGASHSVRRQPKDDDVDCGDADVVEPNLRCEGRARNGPGEVFSTSAGWELRNFDIDKHFLKQGHVDGLEVILPALKAFIDANPGKQINLIGEASTTAGTCYNLRLSRRRARCVARKLMALGIPESALNVDWIGDLASEQRLAMKTDPVPSDRENPDDRRVRIEIITTPPQPDCPPDAKLRFAYELVFRVGCLSRNRFSVVIADTARTPNIYREFVWEKLLASSTKCEFLPKLDPTTTIRSALRKPARLAWTEDPLAQSDFAEMALQRSVPVAGDPENVLKLFASGEEVMIDFPGVWDPASCEAAVKAGTEMQTLGVLRPVGPVQCGPMPVPKAVPCHKPPKEKCPPDREESSAKRFKATLAELTGIGKWIDWFGDQIVGHESRMIKIGTIKTDDEKNRSGDDIWRPYLFIGKVVLGPEGCEQRDPQEDARGKRPVGDAAQLSKINFRPARLVRKANSNKATLWILGLGTFDLFSDKCPSGEQEILVGSIQQRGDVRCEPLEMEDPPSEETCKVDCPDARRTCANGAFRFKFGRIDPANAPPVVQEIRKKLGCDAEAARVNIGSMSIKPIWRPFYWVQPATCPFTVRSVNLSGGAGKATIGVKPKFQFKWPPVASMWSVRSRAFAWLP